MSISFIKAIRYLKFSFVFIAVLQISGCATKTIAFRAFGPQAPECQRYAGGAYSTGFQEKLAENKNLTESEILGNATGCYEQHDELMLGNTSDSIKYRLNFLEFREDGELRDPDQWKAIQTAIAQTPGPRYVVMFVHGWRHDARPDDSNVQAFRTMLAYAARHLYERQSEYGKDAQVIGIYVGWPGNSWRWNWIDSLQVPTWLTFESRKKESEDLAPYVSDYIHRIRYELDASSDPENLNRFLIVGHSLGGNLLINALKDEYENLIPPEINNVIQPIHGVSDLTVLLNPASDFKNWKEIQANEYEKSGYHIPPKYESFIHNDKQFFSPDQKPILMSLTGTCDWDIAKKVDPHHDKEKDGPLDCDTATRWAFSIAQILTLHLDPDQYRAIGHVRAYRGVDGDGVPNQDYGTTHELEVGNGSKTEQSPSFAAAEAPNHEIIERAASNATMKVASLYVEAATEPTLRKCPSGDYWLAKAQAAMSSEGGREWDSDRNEESKIPAGSGRIPLQMRQGTFRQEFRHEGHGGCEKEPTECVGKTYNTLGPAHDPFWNVASHESIIPDHDAVFSPPLLCLLDQIVLDPIVGRPLSPERTATSGK
jgi:hypothetical protein